jgi:hypothetical protein
MVMPIDEDPMFDTEVQKLLEPGNTELLRGLRPETLQAMGLVPAARKSLLRPRVFAFAALAAGAAALVFTLALPAEIEGPTGALAPTFYGQIESSRGAGEEKQPRAYRASSMIRVELTQPKGSRIAAGMVRMFEVGEDQRLRAIVVLDRTSDAAGVRFVFQGRVGDLFDSAFIGTKKLVFVAGGFSSDLSELSGEELATVEARRDLRCFVEEISIVSSGTN